MSLGRILLVCLLFFGVTYTCSRLSSGAGLQGFFSGDWMGSVNTEGMTGDEYLDCCVRGDLALRFESSESYFSTEEERYQMGDVVLVGQLRNTADRDLRDVVVEIHTRHDAGSLGNRQTVTVGPLAAGQTLSVREFAMNLHDSSLDDNPDTASFQTDYQISLASVRFARR